jgi:hypothetical protein
MTFEAHHKRSPFAETVCTLTAYDAQKISDILSSASDAIRELLEYSGFDVPDNCENFPCEDRFYNLSSNVLKHCESAMDEPF